ncbi:MAG: SpoIID/LytB domain-containing protein [Chitinivibrionales bacterium]|nr:SpoIID/LytB domain-containing protein [Chitinivibrionales bacterium]
MKPHNLYYRIALFLIPGGISLLPLVNTGCASSKILTAHPPGTQKPAEKPDTVSTVRGQDTISSPASSESDNLDFGQAFEDTSMFPVEEPRTVMDSETPAAGDSRVAKDNKRVSSLRYPDISVPARKARVALVRNKLNYSLYSVGKVTLHGPRRNDRRTVRGRIAIEASSSENRVLLSAGSGNKREVAVPCTLLSESEYNFIELDDGTYRGAMIIITEKTGKLSLVNYLDVEDYLRGVVPLEIGHRKINEIEAVKAQAVAARTYTYRKISDKQHAPFDLVATVADQVYGGVNAESRMCDKAVRLTEGLVMTCRDSLIFAYYHSTCGGKTANIEDVWKKPQQPYLQSIRDCDENGKAYCSISKYYNWTETWPARTLSSIINRNGGDSGCRGTIKGMKIKWRYSCGRIAGLVVHTSQGTCTLSGDKIRFVFRRNSAGNPILRSCNFRIVSGNSRTVTIEGRGYGHGVGMCQMGAVGRARAGQRFEEILAAYYSGIELKTAVVE